MDEVTQAVEALRRSGVILYPTDTVWGLGCDATNREAVERIYALKRRTDKLSMIVLVDSADNLVRYVRQVPEVAWDLLKLSHKPLTLILPEGVGVAENLLPPEGTIAVRIPDNDFCREVIRKLRRPLVSTSANISGEKSPANFNEITQIIKDGVDLIVDRKFECGATGKPSSIVKLGLTGEVEVIRP